MYNEQIENLIDLALADGELTEKEKQVLFKKAEAAGIDLDEFEMVLDARLFEKNKAAIQIPVSAPKSDKFGDVKKCPACGTMITAFSSSCNECGYEFRNVGVNNSVQLLSDKLENIIIECNKMSFEDSSLMGSFADSKQKEDARKENEILNRQRQVIKNFPIPNTREDILELLYFVSPKTKVGFGSDKNVSAWRIKFSEIINRAKIAFKTDSKMLAEIAEFERQQKSSFFLIGISKFNELSKQVKTVVTIIIVFALFFGVTGIYSAISHKENTQIEQTVEQPQQLLNDLKPQLVAEEARLKEMNKFRLGRSGSKKAQQISDQTLIIEKLKNRIDSLENIIK